MEISILIKREEFGQGTDAANKAKAVFESLAATEFPLHLMRTSPKDTPPSISCKCTVADFVTAIGIKKRFLATDRTKEDSRKMIEELKPILEKE